MKNSASSQLDMLAIESQIESGEVLSCPLPLGGQLHIERPQPFLCFYRHPKNRVDTGTERLPTTQASYLIAAQRQPSLAALSDMIKTIMSVQSRNFGAALLLEIWTTETKSEADADTGTLRPKFRFIAARHGAPLETLEEFEKALLTATWPSGSPEIEIEYRDSSSPPGMPPVLSESWTQKTGVAVLGLEISPVFRAPDSGALYPEVLANLRHALGLAMRRAFYTFAHTRATYRPAHYHELGPQLLGDVEHAVDRALARIDDSIDLLLNVTPINAPQAWHRFRRSRFLEAPEFHYRALKVDPVDLKRRLYLIPVEEVEDPALHHVFSAKREELDRQISMLSDRGTGKFLLESQQVFGSPDAVLVETADRILAEVPAHTHDDHITDSVDAKTFAKHAEAELARYREQDPSLKSEVEIRSDVPGILVSHGNLLIGAGVTVARQRIEATLQHEIGTHVLTYHNGSSQPFALLHTGLAGYEELQEGIAVLSEFLVGGLSRPRFRQIAARVIAVHRLVEGATFLEVFHSLHDEYEFSQSQAYGISMRVFRGGGFTKDMVYLRGLIRLLAYLENGGSLEALYIGKIALEHVEIIEELRWRRILGTPPLLPKYLSSTQAQTCLANLVESDVSAVDLVLESFS